MPRRSLSISGIERLLLATGSGNDRIVNSVANTRDEIYSGAGNDTISVGSDSSVDAGPGNDTITVAGSMNSRDSIDGGDGSDVLSIDYSSLDGSQSYVVASAAGLNTRLNNTTSFQVIRDTLAGAQSFTIELNTGAQTKYINVEHVNLTTSTLAPINDLLIFQGGTSYHGGAGLSMASSSGVDSGDTFFADWSAATTDITWVNVPSTTQVVNGVSISGIERLLVATGNGDDTVTNSAVNTDDEIHAGAGNDLVAPGGGSDRVFGDAGLDAVAFGDARSAHSIARNGSMLTVSSRTGAIDTLVDVERLQFSDLSLAFDTEGNAGRAARLIGTLFGRQYVEDKPIVGLALGLLDSGMSYPALIAAAVATPAFAALAGSHSNADFVRAVYRNLVGVSPPAADLASLTGLLDSGQQTQASLALIACDLELTGVRVDLAGIASEGLGYFPWMG
jgi:Ca2+-binding RTX toxin-like protein